ncbi:MAG: NAD(P)H-dependent oxidoreductase subunit E [Clostridia bacterium]|nr:NAD(P)H-dependent oxidoreductase subunit E [Clostridia bacterium]
MSKICQVEFKETAEQAKKLQEIIENYKHVEGAAMPVLQQAQDIYGYLPEEVQKRIAEGLGVSEEFIYGVATFYSQFTMNPRGQYNFSVCLGTACYVKGSGDIMAKLKDTLKINEGECTPDGIASIQATRCIGCCGLAPVMVVNSDVYGKLTVDDVPKIVDKYLKK